MAYQSIFSSGSDVASQPAGTGYRSIFSTPSQIASDEEKKKRQQQEAEKAKIQEAEKPPPKKEPGVLEKVGSAVTSLFKPTVKPKAPENIQSKPSLISQNQEQSSAQIQPIQSSQKNIFDSTNLSRQSYISAASPKQNNFLNNVISKGQEIWDGLFGISPQERVQMDTNNVVAKAQNAYTILKQKPELKNVTTLSKLTQTGGNPFKNSDFETYGRQAMQEAGVLTQPSNAEFTNLIMALSLPVSLGAGTASLAPSVGKQLLGLGAWTAVSTTFDAAFHKLTDKQSVSELLPQDAPIPVKVAIDALEFLGKAYITHGIYKKAPDIKDFFTKNTIEKYNLPQEITITSQQLRDIHQSGKLTTTEEKNFISKAFTGREQEYKDAIKNKSDITITPERIVDIVDKSYWAKLKGILRQSPSEPKSKTIPSSIIFTSDELRNNITASDLNQTSIGNKLLLVADNAQQQGKDIQITSNAGSPIGVTPQGTKLGAILVDPKNIELINETGKIATANQTTNEKITTQLRDETLIGKRENFRLDQQKNITIAKNYSNNNLPVKATPDTLVKIYRAGTDSETKVGDFVTLDEVKAEEYVTQRAGSKVMTAQVPLKDLVFSGGLKSEFIFSPKTQPTGAKSTQEIAQPTQSDTPKKGDINFTVTLDNGEKVDVTYNPNYFGGKNLSPHFEFRGKATSSTGYKSDFLNSIPKGMTIQEAAKIRAEGHAEEQSAINAKNKKTKPKPPLAKISNIERSTAQEKINSFLAQSSSPEDMGKRVTAIINPNKDNPAKLKVIRAAFMKNMFEMSGASTGYYKADFAHLQQMRKDAQLGPLLDSIQKGISEIDSLLGNTGGEGAARGTFANLENITNNTGYFKSIEFPEIVAIAKQLSGQAPTVKKNLRGSLGRAYSKTLQIKLSAEIFKSPTLAAKVLSHEIGHIADYLPEGDKRTGNLVSRIASLHKYLKRLYENLDNKVIRGELLALSKEWRPYNEDEVPEAFIKYRQSPSELYADAISVLLNDPIRLKTKAPNFWTGFFDYLDQKPEVKQAYFDTLDLLNKGEEEVFNERRKSIREGYQKAEDMQKADTLEKLKTKTNIFHALDVLFNDKNAPINRRVKQAIKGGARIEDSANPIFEQAGMSYMDGKVKNFVLNNYQPPYAKANEVSDGWDTLGEIVQQERVINERGELANPGGFSPETAKSYLENLEKKFTPEDWAKLQEAKALFYKAGKNVVDLMEKDKFKSSDLIEQMKANPAYATFQVVDYATDNLTSAIHHQVGTLKDIANPATATVMKSIVIMRAIEYNNAKKVSLDFQKEFFSKEIEKAKTFFDGKKRQFVESKDKEKGLVMVVEDGKLQGYYLPHDVAYILNGTSDKHIVMAAKLSRLLTGTPFYRPLFTTMNLGFQTFNFSRDLWRFWRSFPHTTLAGVLVSPVTDTYRVARGYAKAAIPVGKSVLNKRDPLIEEMENSKILGLTYNDLIIGQDDADKQIERVLQRSNVLFKSKKRGIFTPIFKTLQAIEIIGDFIERLPKVAGYIELKGSMPEKELAHFIRTKVGSPSFRTGGELTPVTNNILMFSNAMKEGYKTDFKTATQPKTRSSWWWKTLLTTMLPTMLMVAQQLGVFGDKKKKEMQQVSEYDKTNYHILTLGLDENGKTIYIRPPQDEWGRLIGGLTWKLSHFIEGNKSGEDAIANLFDVIDYGGGQMPHFTPSWQAAGAIMQYLGGHNPYDSFRNKNVIPDTEYKAGFQRSFPIFMDWLVKQQGAGIVVPTFTPQGEMTDLQKTLNTPVLSNILGRWIKVSDFGQTEINTKIQKGIESQAAEETLQRRDLVNGYIKEWQASDKSAQKKNELVNRYVEDAVAMADPENKGRDATLARKKMTIALDLGEYGANTDSLIKASSNDAKVEILKRVQKEMSNDEFTSYRELLLEEGIISGNVIEKLNRK